MPDAPGNEDLTRLNGALPVTWKPSIPVVSAATNNAVHTDMKVDQQTSSIVLWDAQCSRLFVSQPAEDGSM